MNPCLNCSLDKQGCHESGFANERCKDWIKWKTQVYIWQGEARQAKREQGIEEGNNEMLGM